MNYLEWNNAIIKHFFNSENEEKEVILYFSERIVEEIGIENFQEPEDGYIKDFYKAIRLGVNGVPNNNYLQRVLDLETKYSEGTRGIDGIQFDYPPYLTYLLAFILPFTSGVASEDFNMNNFHDYAKRFFEEKGLTENYDGIIKHNLYRIDFLWETIDKWLIDVHSFSLGYLEEINPPSTRRYVGKFEYHIMFRKEQEERLSKVFDENNILPGEVFEKDKIRELLYNQCNYLRLSANTIQKINNQDDYIGNKIVERVHRFYKNWDGTVYTVEGQRGYSRNRLVICLDFNLLSKRINFKYFRIFSKKGIPENSSLTKPNRDIIINICQNREFYSNPVENCFENLETNIELKDEANRTKYSWKIKDFLLFKRIPNLDWVEIQKIEYNIGKTLVICKRNFFKENLEDWFENIENNKRLFNDNIITQLPEDWLAFTIENITNYTHPTLKELIPDQENKPKINFDKSFYTDGNLFKDKLPYIWIENIETTECIIAKYNDENEIPLNQLLINDIDEEDNIKEVFTNKYVFNEKHIEREGIEFKLVCGNIETNRYLNISDFRKRNNDEIEYLLPQRNSIGQTSNQEECYVKGLEHFFSNKIINNLKPNQNLLDNFGHVFKNIESANHYATNTDYNTKHPGNILIHYISTKGKLKKDEFDNAVFKLLENLDNNEDIKKRANYLRYQLQDIGYIDYNAEKSLITINKPHLVIKPTEKGTTTFLVGARDSQLINSIINFSKNNNISVEIQDDNDTLFPQIVYIKFKEISHSVVSDFANQFDLMFKKDGLYTQFTLASHFGDISKWKDYVGFVENEIEDFEGGYLFDIETLKFINKQRNFDRKLAFVKFTEINGYKTVYRLWYKNEAYNITDQQFGIYLYLYLYKKIREDNYQDSKKEKGWVNCREDLDEREKAYELTNIVLYDSRKKYLAVPLDCRLPRYLSISVALLNGIKPEIKYLDIEDVRYKGMYLIYKNVPTLFLNNTINLNLLKPELRSSLIEININI